LVNKYQGIPRCSKLYHLAAPKMSASTYNDLPLLKPAKERLDPIRDALLSSQKLKSLLKEYKHQYGVCLIHRHYEINEGEFVVSDGNETKPQPEGCGNFYPERWLPDGTPYEFSRQQGKAPPKDLQKRFREVLRGIAGGEVNRGPLGLFFVHAIPHPNCVFAEETDVDRKLSTIREVDAGGIGPTITTGWIPSLGLECCVCFNTCVTVDRT
jgi:hypothetical protein